MKHLLAILLILSCSTILIGQNFAPIGATWHYQIQHSSIGNIEYGKWEAIKDTVILGKNTREVKRTFGIEASFTDSVYYVYEDSGIVYKYLEATNSFTTLYNFNKNMGESWSTQVDTNCIMLIMVDSTSSIIINADTLKVLHISSALGGNGFWGPVIEKIGHQVSPLPHIEYICNAWHVDGAWYTGLRCYSDTIIGSYDSGLSTTCEYIYIGIEELTPATINIHPNPTSGAISISLEEVNKGSLRALNSLGQVVFEEDFKATKELNISLDGPSGLYFIQIEIDGELITKKVVKE